MGSTGPPAQGPVSMRSTGPHRTGSALGIEIRGPQAEFESRRPAAGPGPESRAGPKSGIYHVILPWYIPCDIELWYHMVYTTMVYTTIGIYHLIYIPWYITYIIPVYTIPYYMVYTMLYSILVLPHHMWYTMWYHTSDASISHGISHRDLFEPISQPISQRWYIPTSMVYTMWYHTTQPSRWEANTRQCF